MDFDKSQEQFDQVIDQAYLALVQFDTYAQLGIVLISVFLALLLSRQVRKQIPMLGAGAAETADRPLRRYAGKLGNLLFPVFSILFLRISVEISQAMLQQDWLVYTALTINALLLFNAIIDNFVSGAVAGRWIKWVGMPIVFMHYLGVLSPLVEVLESISMKLGNFELSAYGIIRVLIFGTLLFWLARVVARTGRDIIGKQASLDLRTREVSVKLFEVTIFFVVFLVILQVMGINLTALAVFGGALGVGLGFGLQSIASNFISGIILLLDRSLSIGDFVELDDGRSGTVREMNMRSTTLESFDGKDVMVPNEKFIVEPFTNWTHKDKRQRYRVDFSVAYSSDVPQLVEIIKQVVASHPQVISGDDVPIEERPDCEIDSFGDNGINMFVEFWMEGIDDGKNRVGGDLLLMILQALQEHGFEIPYPQREVRVLNPSIKVDRG